MMQNRHLRLAVWHLVCLTVALLTSCAPATAQTLDSARVFPRVVVFTDSVTALDSVKWYTRIPPPVHDTTIVHDTLPVVHDTLPRIHDTLPVVHDTVCPPPAQATLKALGQGRRLTMGTMITVAMATDPAYKAAVVANFTSVMPGNELKWSTHPSATTWTFTNADSIVNFATANGMVIHGHTLVWPDGTPSWVAAANYTKAQQLAVLKQHIDTLVGRFKGRVTSWDVVNEATTSTGGYEPAGRWIAAVGPEYIDSAFVWTHRADPAAKLYYNDYGAEGPGVKADSILARAIRLKARGVPIDGVGFQAHLPKGDGSIPSAASVKTNLTRFTAAGLDIRVSEMDVRVANSAPASGFITQAVTYRDMLDACLSLTRCGAFTVWGLSDKYSSVPIAYPGYGRALPFDSTFHPKPALDSLVARLRRVP